MIYFVSPKHHSPPLCLAFILYGKDQDTLPGKFRIMEDLFKIVTGSVSIMFGCQMYPASIELIFFHFDTFLSPLAKDGNTCWY